MTTLKIPPFIQIGTMRVRVDQIASYHTTYYNGRQTVSTRVTLLSGDAFTTSTEDYEIERLMTEALALVNA